MISTLPALADYARRTADRCGDGVSENIFAPPGITPQTESRLQEAIPGLPNSYLKCLERFELKGVRFGYFALWPEAYIGQTLAECLIRAYSEQNRFLQMFRSESLAQIACWEADPVVVACKRSAFPEGTILKISVGSPVSRPTELARDFETFLLFVGNMDEVASHLEGSSALAEFGNRLRTLGATPAIATTWKGISEVVFLK